MIEILYFHKYACPDVYLYFCKKKFIFIGDEILEIRKTSMRNRKPKRALDVECLDAYEVDDNGFIDGDVNFGVPVATFSFGGTHEQLNYEVPIQKSKAVEVTSVKPYAADFNKNAPLRGLTPPINGEEFTLKRGYQFRPSTLRKLNELKAKHPDVNVYLNTILDAAISHYYDYIFNGDGQF